MAGGTPQSEPVGSPQRTPTRSFAGHLGHLSPQQEAALDAFKSSLADAALYTPPTDTTKASHDDPTLLRFLRARSFNVSAAQKQFQNAEQWRKQHDVDNLFATFDPVELEDSRRFYPRWTGRRDKHGLPLYVYRVASLIPIQKELDAVPPERRYQRIVALYEAMIRFTFALCTHLPHQDQEMPISCTASIIDLTDVSFPALWSLRGHLQEASRLATANYPETLGVIAIVNSPPFFPTIWGWIKGWFDEGTRNKIFVLGKDAGPTLRGLVHVEDLPKVYGGDLEWVFEDEPRLDEDAKAVIEDMPKGAVIFVDDKVSKPF